MRERKDSTRLAEEEENERKMERKEIGLSVRESLYKSC